jgi:hypothetical protein
MTSYSELELRTTTWAIGRLLADVAGLGSINELVGSSGRIVGKTGSWPEETSFAEVRRICIDKSAGRHNFRIGWYRDNAASMRVSGDLLGSLLLPYSFI